MAVTSTRKQLFKFEEFAAACDRVRKVRPQFDLDPEAALTDLLKCNVIGMQMTAGTQSYAYTTTDFLIDTSRTFCVHRSLFKALQIY
jgi:hypothetical protein